MAFVNERLSSAQMEEFVNLGIKSPISREILKPHFWTADKERNAYLIDVGAYHDLPEEELFVFIYNSGIFLFKLKMSDISETTKAWRFVNYKPLDNSELICEKQLMAVFKDALTEYKYNGLPAEYKQQFIMKIEF